MVASPAETPETTPVVELTVALSVLREVKVTAPVELITGAKVTVDPTATVVLESVIVGTIEILSASSTV